ncbi:MAG: S1 RNA-binding domain-containing protein [Deltaproteobacteria bacterium]|nr:S1 RNA-binding domain-containing protein [Deltaproteobacteria bacterium]
MSQDDLDMNFAELFEASERLAVDGPLLPGEPVKGKVVLITGDTVFIDYGAKSEGWADLQEFVDDKGERIVKTGMEVELSFIGYGPSGPQLGNCLRKVSGSAGVELLRKAFETGIAIEGTVTGTNKGGMEIVVSGAKAFCPFSQMDLTYLDRPEGFIGTTQKFKVTQFEEEGKNIVLSRRAVLQAEKEALALQTRKRLGVGEVFRGQVTRLTPFGAFVDLGGIEGLVHISEISRSQVADPADHLTAGQEVTVQVLQIKADEKNQERISLSMKVLEPDPWETELGFNEGEIVLGRVRNLAQFGAFIEIAPGIEGLVHISEIAHKRIRHPKEILKEGQEIEVKVLEINQKQRRISLSIKEVSPFSGMDIDSPEPEMVRTGNVIRRRVKMAADQGSLMAAPNDFDPSPDQSTASPTLLPPPSPRFPEVGLVVRGIIRSIKPYGFFADLPELGSHQRGLLHKSQMVDSGKNQSKKGYQEGDEILVEIIKIDEQGRISLSQQSILDNQNQAEMNEYRERVQETGKLGTMADLFKKK